MRILAALLLFLALVSPCTAQATGTPAATPPVASFADLADQLLPAVVNISSTQKIAKPEDLPEMPHFPPGSPFEDFFQEFMDRQGEQFPAVPQAALGSGFVIDAEKGYIVTNNHVIKDADEVRVTFHDDTTVDAQIIGRDEKMDLAVLQVKTDKKLTAARFGNSDALRVGDWVLAIGNPFGLGGTVTAGIVSAQQRDINAGPYDDFIQTDASINRGNSGGPMFNLNGEVIGINTAIYSPSGGSVGIGFAIPINLSKPVISQLIEYGRTRRGWLGVRIQAVTDEIAESLGLDKTHGALIASITPGSPAEKAGLAAGDIVIEFNGKAIDEMRQLPRIVAETKIGEKAKITYWRDNKKKTVLVEVGELEKAEEEGLIDTAEAPATKEGGVTIDTVGITITPISSQDREQFSIPDDVNGIIVREVKTGSEAEEKGLSAGDVIVEINQQPVADPGEAEKTIKAAQDSGRKSILLLINREGDVRFVALRLKK